MSIFEIEIGNHIPEFVLFTMVGQPDEVISNPEAILFYGKQYGFYVVLPESPTVYKYNKPNGGVAFFLRDDIAQTVLRVC